MFDTYNDVVTVAEVQEMLKIGRKRVYELIANEDIVARRIGRKYRIQKASIIAFMNSQK